MELRPAHPSSRGCAIGFFCYGALALIAQLVCFQELLIVFAGHELFLGFSLSAWMGWVGVGSWLVRRRASSSLSIALPWLIPILLANLVVIRLSKCLFGFGMLVGLAPMLILTAVLLAPIGLIVGALFSWGYEWAASRHGFSLGHAYLWDTLGTACGGIVYATLIAGRLAPEWVVALLALPTAASAGVLAPRRGIVRCVAASLPIVAALLFAISPLPRATRALQWRGYTLLAERQSRYAHLVLAQTGSLTSLFENGLIAAHFPDPAAHEELVHWPLLAHAAPRRVLIIGSAATGSLAELLKHPVERVDHVELDPAIIQLLTPRLPPADRAALSDPRVRLIHQDGRRYLTRAAEPYDIILLQLPEPLTAQINRLYTLEAFRAIRQHLAPGGLFAFTIPSSENYLSPETAYFNASLYHTLAAAFDSVELVAGDPLLVLAGPRDLALDPAVLTQRYRQRRLQTREVVPSYVPIKLDPGRRAALLERLTSVRRPLVNRDFFPVCYAAAFRVWLSKFISPIYFLGVLALIALAASALRSIWRRRAALTRQPGPAALFALGCAGIVYETVLLLAFQAIHGYVYWQLGFLFAAFMLGLALGSALAMRRLSRLDAAQAHGWLRVLLLATGLEGAALVWILSVCQHLPLQIPWLVPFGFLLAISGVWLGAAFPLASRVASAASPIRIAGTLYAADLWGAALGAVLTSACLVPLVGLLPTIGVTGFVLLVTAWSLPSIPQSAFRNPQSG